MISMKLHIAFGLTLALAIASISAGVSAQPAGQVEVSQPLAASDVGTLDLPAFTEDPGVPEPDYAEVAADARTIADEIESRLIEQHMLDATSELGKTDAIEGYPKMNEAYVDMKEMIKFCESTSGKGQNACKFKLQMTMGLKPGNTLGQLGKGMGMGIGFFGFSGQGSAGQAGGQTPFGVFGPESFGRKTRQSSRLGPKEVKDVRGGEPGEPDPLAGSIEELGAAKNEDLDLSAEGDERIMEEYRKLIEEYFKRMAEEE